MSDITQFIDEHGLTVEDVIDSLDIDSSAFENVPDEPHDFYDDEPTVSDLADDFDAVDLLVDKRDELAAENDALREEVRDARRPVFANRAEYLAEMTEKWGDKADLVERFDATDEDDTERWTVDDIEAKIELVEDIEQDLTDSEITTVTDNSDDDVVDDEPDIPTTENGRFDLRSETKV